MFKVFHNELCTAKILCVVTVAKLKLRMKNNPTGRSLY